MSMSLADLDKWNPDAIHQVFAAATDHSAVTRQTAQGFAQIMNSVPWDGVAYEAAARAGAGIQRDLELQAQQLDAVARAACTAESEIRRIKSDWQQILRMADRWGLTIDINSNEILPPQPPPTKPDDIAKVEHRMDIIHDEIVDLLVRANSADRDLAAAIDGATGAMSPEDVEGLVAADTEDVRKRNQADAFRQIYGRDPVTGNEWLMAAAMDPHSYEPKYVGVAPQIVAGRFTPQPGKGVVRSNMFIPTDEVQNLAKDATDLASGRFLPMNLGDNRGPSATADPQASRVSVFVDYDNGVVVVRQNPTVNADGLRGGAAAATPDVHVVQAPDGRMTIDYNASDAYENPLGTAAGVTVNGRITLNPQVDGSVALGGSTTIYPSMETYQYRDGQSPVQLQWDPANSGSSLGPGTSLMRHHWIGDSTIPPVRPDMPGWLWELENANPFGDDPFISHTTKLVDPFGGSLPTVATGR